MGKLGATEVILIVVVALLIFGPAKLPQLGKAVGETMREFKKSMKSVAEDDDQPQSPPKSEEKQA